METIENNRLIAEFMGMKLNPENNMYKPLSGVIHKRGDELLFHCSWDWLMPVVEKIDGLMLGKENLSAGYYNSYLNEEGVERNDFLIFRLSKEGTYKEVIEFIKWYNDNQ